MNATGKLYIRFISSVIGGADLPQSCDNINWDDMITLCGIHRNAALLYTALQNALDVPEKAVDTLKRGFQLEVADYAKKSSVFGILTGKLKERGIGYIAIKGIAISRFYPQRELRSMGDIDLIVKKEDLKKVKAAIEEASGSYVLERSKEKDEVYRLSDVTVEFHTEVGYEDTLDRYDYDKYFSDVWDHLEQIFEGGYVLEKNYDIIYTMYHIAKHFYNNGFGVRMITDLAVMILKYDKELNFDYIYRELKKIKLEDFGKKILCICKSWFGLSIEKVPEDFAGKELIEDYILSSGVFGFENVGRDISDLNKEKSRRGRGAVIRWIFPSCRQMRKISSWFEKKNALLLPAAYVERLVRNSRQRGGIRAWIRELSKGRSQNRAHDEALSIMGLLADGR